MLKRIISFLMILIISLTTISFAETENNTEEVKVYNKGIYINGEKIINAHSVYPYFVYDDIIYLPLTVENSKILGFKLLWDEEKKTIQLSSAPVTMSNYEEQWIKQDWKTLAAQKSEKKLMINDKPYVSETYPIFDFNHISYIPLTQEVVYDFLGWDLYYNSFTGLYLSTLKDVKASNAFDEEAFKYDKALAEYAMNINKDLTESEALEIIMLIEEKCDLYDMNELLIFAIMWQESNFNPNDYYGGAIGLMQIMGSTGKNYGLSREMLYDKETNVDFGVKYLKDKIDIYDGSIVLGITAYNQGVGNVNRGTYSTRYYEKIMEKKAKIEAYMKEKGFLAAELETENAPQ